MSSSRCLFRASLVVAAHILVSVEHLIALLGRLAISRSRRADRVFSRKKKSLASRRGSGVRSVRGGYETTRVQ
jgi:hypothetical protein